MGLLPAVALTLPALACDCHMHVDVRRFPAVADYRALQARLGLHRTVAVTPSTYGTDNASLPDARALFGGRARGVAVCDAGVSDAAPQALHAAGVRGLRFNQTLGASTSLTNIAFGGPDRQTLYGTESVSGSILRATLDAPGLPVHRAATVTA